MEYQHSDGSSFDMAQLPQPTIIYVLMLEGIVATVEAHDENAGAEQETTLTTVFEVLLTCGDTVSDIVNLVLLWDSHFGPIMLGMLIFANLMQVVFTRFVNHQGVLATIASLLGLKPLVDGVQMILGIDSRSAFSAGASFAFSRIVETASEAIPQAILQALALFTTRSAFQYVSLTWTILGIAYTFVSVIFAFDKSDRGASGPRWYGFIEDSKEIVMGVTETQAMSRRSLCMQGERRLALP